MKKIFLSLTLAIITFAAISQDYILTTDGKEIASKVVEVTTTEIKYLNADNPDGPVYVIEKSRVSEISYVNGYKDVFAKAPDANVNYYLEGQTDAAKFYKGYKGAGTGTLLTSLLISPLVGLVPAIACSSTKPKETNLNYPYTDLYREQPDYQRGYANSAKRIKQKKVWNNWTIALMVNIVVFAAMSR